MNILVIGSKGQLGRCLNDKFENTIHNVTYSCRKTMDISNFKSTRIKINIIKPDVVINASAYTAVDKAEDDVENANLVNNLAVANIATICKELDCWLIHLSTDYVFDGTESTPYAEESLTNPKSVYGRTKLKGEQAIQSIKCKYLIIRTAWVFSEYGSNFFKTMLKLGTKKKEISVVGDQFGCPTYAQNIADVIVLILNTKNFKELDSQIYHFCGSYSCSWHEFVNLIFNEAEQLNINTPKTIISIKSSDYPTAASRPLFSVLDCSKIRNDFDIPLYNIQDDIISVLKSLTNDTI